MSNLNHLFYIGERVYIRFGDEMDVVENRLYNGIVKKTSDNYIIVDVDGVSDHCYFDNEMLDMVIPAYNIDGVGGGVYYEQKRT